METTDEAKEYKLTLAELKSNNKTQINLLTILAEDYKESASSIVDVIEAHLYTVPPAHKLVVMYVCDSILKNVKGVYVQLFAKKIVSMFLHIFQHGDEKVRASLYKIRVTWNASKVFLPSKLYQLDLKVNAMDTAWPIVHPKTPADASPAPSVQAQRPPPPAAHDNKVFVNKKFIQPTSSAARSIPPTNTVDRKPTTTTSSQKTSPNAKTANIKKENRAVDLLDKLLPATSKNASPAGTTNKRKAELTSGNGPANPKKRSLDGGDLDLRPSRSRSIVKDEDLRQKHAKTIVPKSNVIKPTSVAGSHAFLAPPKPRSPPVMQQPHAHVPPPMSIPLPIPQMMPPVVAPPVKIEVPQPPVVNHYSQELSEDSPSAVIYDGSVKLDIPQNNRIFVDGKCYEVMFIDDTAVIERAGAPHRIYFSGPPRSVVVDGKSHPLKFGETRTIEIGGSYHTVRFGAPGRELYIGGHPFKGHFGGPSINAFVNSKRYDIRITGGAPEVKIEPDPAYDLARFLSKMREDKKIEMKQDIKPAPEDPFNFLRTLQERGYLKALQQPQQLAPIQPPKQNRRPPPSRPVLLPEPVGASGSSVQVERRPVAPSLKDFNLRLLKVRYENVVSNLLRKRDNCCSYCGMRLDSMPKGSKEYKDHTDAHIKRGLNKQDTSNRHRHWYPTSDAWLTTRAEVQATGNERKREDEPQVPVMGVESSNQRDCAVCCEKFDEYFDDDEDMWRFRDTINVKGKIVHVNCSTDASLLETPTCDMMPPVFASEFREPKEEPMDEQEDVKPIINSRYETKPLIGR